MKLLTPKKESKMKKIGMFLVTLLLVTSCDYDSVFDENRDEKSDQVILSIDDPRLYGMFTYYTSWKTSYSRKYISETYHFDGSNPVSYTYKSGYTSGYDTYKYNCEYEIEILNGKFRKRLYNNTYSTWSNWEVIYFNDNGNKLYIKDQCFKFYN